MAVTDSSIVDIKYEAVETSIGYMIFPHVYVNNTERSFTNTSIIAKPIAVQCATQARYTQLEGSLRQYHSVAGDPPGSVTITFPSIRGLEIRATSATGTYVTSWYYNNTRIMYDSHNSAWDGITGFCIITDVNNVSTPCLISGYLTAATAHGEAVIVTDYPAANKFGTFLGQNTGYYGPGVSGTVAEAVVALILGQSIPAADVDSEDPYDPGGNTEPGGGDGDLDDSTDPIDFPVDPIISAVDTGFITLFNPTLSQLNNLANYMWGSLFDLENFKKLFANPMDAILGLSVVPVAVPNGGTSNVKVGNIDTGVSMNKAGSQYVNVDCGTLNIKEYWGAYLDYSPYTKAEIFLPFIGTHPLDIDDIMKKAVHVKYKVDILSGACIANIKCGDAVLYSYAGQCAATIPVTGRDWTNVVGSALSIVGNVAGAAVTGGMLAPMAAANVAQAATNMSKPNIQKSGSVAGMAGIMGIQKPYIMLTRPRQAVPKKQNHYTGYPSFITTQLSKCSGYTEIEAVHLEGVPGTTEELAEIERLLQSGVIF